MSIQKNIEKIKKEIQGSELIVVTKKQLINDMKTIYDIGERKFGENRVNDILIKKALLPDDIEWHMIGHLQTNKVKLITPFIHMIQSVDSIKLLNKINECGKKDNRIIKCLIQIKITEEITKYGFSEKEGVELLNSNYQKKYRYVNIKGVMGMASFTANIEKVESEFKNLKRIYDNLKSQHNILSMGMSNDYKIAQKIGSNMIRIGSLIFDKN